MALLLYSKGTEQWGHIDIEQMDKVASVVDVEKFDIASLESAQPELMEEMLRWLRWVVVQNWGGHDGSSRHSGWVRNAQEAT